MPITNNPQNFNPNQLSTPGLYVVIQPPPGFIQGQQSNTVAYWGTAAWGAVNTATLCGSLPESQSYFGSKVAASFADVYDLPTACEIAFAQTQEESNNVPSGLGLWLTRITDGTDVAATGHLLDTTTPTPVTGIVLTARYTGSLGNSIQIAVSAGQKTNTFNVDIIPPAGMQPERFLGVPGGAAGVFWSNLLLAINNGQGTLRGPSQLVVASAASGTAVSPAIGTVTLTAGTDGRASVTSANFIGSATADPPTGIYQLTVMDPMPSVAVCVGMTDNTVFSTIQALIDSLAVFTLFSFPVGTDVPTAVAATKTYGIDTPNVAFCKDWIYWYDSLTGQQKLVDPAVFMGARIAALSPENSPLNKAVFSVIGTERMNAIGGFKKYSDTDIGQMQQSGILVITNNPPGGNYWGFPHGSNCSSDLVRHVIEYSRMTNCIAHTLNETMCKFLGQNQSDSVDDPLRPQVKLTLDDFMQSLQSARQIDAYKNVCDTTNNVPATVAKHYMFADCYARYMSSVQYFIINLQGGTTVNITVTTISQQQAQQIGV